MKKTGYSFKYFKQTWRISVASVVSTEYSYERYIQFINIFYLVELNIIST